MEVAIKVLNDQEGMNRESLLREARLMMKLKHKCIVKFIGFSEGPPLRMVQEKVSYGSLLTFLITYRERITPSIHFNMWCAQIALGKINSFCNFIII